MKTSRLSLFIIFVGALFCLNAPQAQAQYFGFGKNKVQYKDFKWRYIQSHHFDVYYYTSKNYDLANFAAISLEAALKQIEEDFGHKIAKRIQVIIYDSHNDFAQTNAAALPIDAQGIGGVTDLYKNRVTLPFDGDYASFESTLHHELTHAVINDMFYGGSAQSLVSGNAVQIPGWFNEGMAEYQSKGFDTQTDMYMRDAVISDYLPPIPQLDSFGGGFFAYRGGESLWNYIVLEYGRNKIEEIFQALKNYRNVDAAFQRTLGLNLKELSKRWQAFYKKRYLPEVANREDIDSFADLLTKDTQNAYNTSPSYSPQGDKIALLTSASGHFNVVVLNAITGKKIKTLIKGNESTDFEIFHVLKPNLGWSPDGSKITISAKSEGQDHLAIVDFETGKKQFIDFPNIDALGSASWSPDGKKIAFDGNIGPFQDIFVYDLATQKLTNLTNDVISDTEPAWSPDSKTIYFTSARGDNLQLGKVRNNADLLATDAMYTTDIYALTLGDNTVRRLTKTPKWNERQPRVTRDGKLLFISDENGIPNVYQLNLQDRTTTPLTNLQNGAVQFSLSSDGSRLAVVSLKQSRPNIYTITAPFSRKENQRLSDNQWAKRRATETIEERVPAIGYVKKMVSSKPYISKSLSEEALSLSGDNQEAVGKNDSTAIHTAQRDTTPKTQQPDTLKANKQNSSDIDFRNYVFSSAVEQDTVFANKYLDEDVFDMKDNALNDGRYIPNDYRLKFSTDIVYAGGGFSTYYGTNGLVQILFSDLLGDHQIAFGTNLVFDLRNSDYFLQYANFKHRVNWLYSLSHTAYNYQTYSNQLVRYRYFTGGVTAQYPLNKFERFDFTMNGVSISRDYTLLGADTTLNDNSSFAYPQITYTKDKTLPGLITPQGGFRYAIGISGSPPITDKTLQFFSALGDFRKYFDLGSRYSFAVRGSAGASFGRDAQTYFAGGEQGWINYKYSNATVPLDQFGSTFIAQPAIPLRGYNYFAISGDRFALLNAEFRFPLVAALLPGPIPIIPLYNLTGVAFIDAGTAWGLDVDYKEPQTPNNTNPPAYYTNDAKLDFKVRKQNTVNIGGRDLPAPEGDILIGAGFGLRTIIFGLPLRYDIAWPYYRNGFGSHAVNYISIGIDF